MKTKTTSLKKNHLIILSIFTILITKISFAGPDPIGGLPSIPKKELTPKQITQLNQHSPANDTAQTVRWANETPDPIDPEKPEEPASKRSNVPPSQAQESHQHSPTNDTAQTVRWTDEATDQSLEIGPEAKPITINSESTPEDIIKRVQQIYLRNLPTTSINGLKYVWLKKDDQHVPHALVGWHQVLLELKCLSRKIDKTLRNASLSDLEKITTLLEKLCRAQLLHNKHIVSEIIKLDARFADEGDRYIQALKMLNDHGLADLDSVYKICHHPDPSALNCGLNILQKENLLNKQLLLKEVLNAPMLAKGLVTIFKNEFLDAKRIRLIRDKVKFAMQIAGSDTDAIGEIADLDNAIRILFSDYGDNQLLTTLLPYALDGVLSLTFEMKQDAHREYVIHELQRADIKQEDIPL